MGVFSNPRLLEPCREWLANGDSGIGRPALRSGLGAWVEAFERLNPNGFLSDDGVDGEFWLREELVDEADEAERTKVDREGDGDPVFKDCFGRAESLRAGDPLDLSLERVDLLFWGVKGLVGLGKLTFTDNAL